MGFCPSVTCILDNSLQVDSDHRVVNDAIGDTVFEQELLKNMYTGRTKITPKDRIGYLTTLQRNKLKVKEAWIAGQQSLRILDQHVPSLPTYSVLLSTKLLNINDNSSVNESEQTDSGLWTQNAVCKISLLI